MAAAEGFATTQAINGLDKLENDDKAENSEMPDSIAAAADGPDQFNAEEECGDNATMNEERFRIDRKKLEHMLLVGLQDDSASADEFFLEVGESTNTEISWPSKLKIGAKSKKDPHIKVIGHADNIKKAKQLIMSVLDTKTSRVTLKMDVSFTDHSHIIGKGGTSIKRVMQDSSCHIHFPDSNRTSSEKSNQVSIAGPPAGVEAARKQIRELLPIVLMFEVPANTLIIPDASSAVINDIAQSSGVSISFKQRSRSYGFIGTARGLHSDPLSVKNAIVKVLHCLTGSSPVVVPVTTQIEIDPKHHTFLIGRNGCNIKQIMQNTGASINFPDPCSMQARRSTIAITGTIESAITAKVQLMDCLPLVLMFDVKDDECSVTPDNGSVNQLMETLDLLVSVKLKPRQESKAIIIKTIERNAANIYIARQQILGETSHLYNFKASPLPTLAIQNGFNAPSSAFGGFSDRQYDNGNGILEPLTRNTQPFSSLESQHVPPSNTDHHRQSYEAASGLNGHAGGGTYHQQVPNGKDDITDALFMNESWKMRSGHALSGLPVPITSSSQLSKPSSLRSAPDNVNPADVNLNGSLSSTTSLMDRLLLQQKTVDYEAKKQLATKAMRSRVTFGEVRTPTDTWSGLGFSKSMPEKALKGVWSDQSKMADGSLLPIPKQPERHLNMASLDSSASSISSTDSTSSDNASDGAQRRSTQGPPPGLEGHKNSLDNANAFLSSNNNDYVSLLSSGSDSSVSVLATVVDLADLFNKLGLSKYTETFQEQEVDLLTFVSLTEEDLKELGVAKFGARRRMVMAIQDLQKIHNIPLLVSPPGTQSPLLDTLNLLPARHVSLDVANQSLRW